MTDPLVNSLVEALRCLPGVGPRSASRMAYHLLLHGRERGLHLSSCLQQAVSKVAHCELCNDLSSGNRCHRCVDARYQSAKQLCIVEMPMDALAIEQSGAYQGRFFVLMGRLSPLDGFGPDKLKLDKLHAFFKAQAIEEVIFALSPTVEGEATVHYLKEQLTSYAVTLTQLASGVPVGGELEYLDANTIGQAMLKRAQLEELA